MSSSKAATKRTPEESLIDFEKAHNFWVRVGRKAAKEWAKQYQPADFLVSIQRVREDFLIHLREEGRTDILALYGHNANHVTIASDLWHWFGRDVRDAMKPRGWLQLPNTLLSKPDEKENGVYGGARDLMVQKARPESPIQHKRIVLEALQAKRERVLKLAENAKNGLRVLEDEIRQHERWIDETTQES